MGRPGLTLLARQGREYHGEKFRELEDVFRDRIVRGELVPEGPRDARAPQPVELADVIGGLQPHDLVLEAEYGVGSSFRRAHDLAPLASGTDVARGAGLAFTTLRPDILHVLPTPAEGGRRVITSSGTLLRPGPGDRRLGLRIIDIKLAGEPSPSHFAELAYYGMALAGWLEDTGRGDRFAVLDGAAIWPGTLDGSHLGRILRERQAASPTCQDHERALQAFEADLEAMPPEVVLGRVQRFFRVDLREVLAEPEWHALDWHLDRRCVGCDYLGYRRTHHGRDRGAVAGRGDPPDGRYYWPMAEATRHLSRVPGLTEGAAAKLRSAGVSDVSRLADLPEPRSALDRHQTLRAMRTLLPVRARALTGRGTANVPDAATTSADLPRFADIRVAVSADFDVGSELTFAFGYRIEYAVPKGRAGLPGGEARLRRRREMIELAAVVPRRTRRSEGETFLSWLRGLAAGIRRAREEMLGGYHEQGQGHRQDVTVHFLVWDRLTYRDLRRVFGRHLQLLGDRPDEEALSLIGWLFPPAELLGEPAFLAQTPPLAILADVATTLVAAPVPHHYGLVGLANSLDPENRRLADGRT